MQVEIKIPSPGESITEVEIARWLVDDNSWVEKDQEIAEVESEKATLPLLASHSGVVSIKVHEGTIKVGEVACTINTDAKQPSKPEPKVKNEEVKEEKTVEKPVAKIQENSDNDKVKVTPLARKLMDEKGLDVNQIISGLKRISTEEVNLVASRAFLKPSMNEPTERSDERITMSQLRKKLSQRLVSVKNETAMLTTFNEVDMSRVIEIRKQYQKDFQEKYGIKLGFMSFFTKAVVEALRLYPMVNSRIEGDAIVTPNYFDIGIAVQTPKGLMVPVLRNAQDLSIPQIEAEVARVAEKGRSGRIGLDDLEGGTFTITNGGVFGSMMSTPILNPPQSGILGMHNILDRPVAVNGKVEIRPMMYVALSYDHRIIDGKDSVGFLVKVKQMIENPINMLVGGENPDRLLLGI